jgi:hypothetical protein
LAQGGLGDDVFAAILDIYKTLPGDAKKEFLVGLGAAYVEQAESLVAEGNQVAGVSLLNASLF